MKSFSKRFEVLVINFIKGFPGYFCFQVSIALIIPGLIISGYYFNKKPNKTNRTENILFIDSSKHVTSEQFLKRKEYLTQIILNHELSYSNYSMARSSERMQTRLSYIALIAALFIALLTKELKYPKQLKLIYFSALCLTVLFYFYDIHIVDLGKREEHTMNLLDNTVIRLNQLPIRDSLYYSFSYDKVDTYNFSMSENSWQRKFCISLRPDVPQIAFYLIPFWVLNFLSAIILQMAKRNTNVIE